MHESGENSEHADGFALGYGGYRREWNPDFDKWTNISRTVPVTDITIRYLVGCPNHYRAWRRSAFEAIGGWCADLHVADDYEILVRTFLSTKMVRVSKKSYTQFVNTPTSQTNALPNNFTWLRNAEIQKIWRSLAHQYNDRIHERLMVLQEADPRYEDWEYGAPQISVAYHETADHHVKLNEVFEPLDQNDSEPLVFLVFYYDPTSSLDKGSGASLLHLCKALAKQTYKNIRLMVVSSGAERVVEPWFDRLVDHESLGAFVRERVCYWNFAVAKHRKPYPPFMCINHALKRICTARYAGLLLDDAKFDSLPNDFVEASVWYMLERPDIHGVHGESVPHFVYQTALHEECGYLDASKSDLLSVLTADDIGEFVGYGDVRKEFFPRSDGETVDDDNAAAENSADDHSFEEMD